MAWQLPLHLRGAVEPPGAPALEFRAEISGDPQGEMTGSLALPTQGVQDAPLEVAHLEDQALRFTLTQVGATWTIRRGDGETLECAFVQQGFEAPCTVESLSAEAYAQLSGAARPQTPEPPFPYEVEEVTYDNSADDVTLAGTLTLPDAEKPVAAALLISGSGAQDRDETVAGHKPFWVIADHLSREGIAVLRVDDRGVGGSSPGTGSPTSEDLARDVKAGLDFLRKHPRIAPDKVGLVGHSEGGIIAPLVASQSPKDVAFVVMLAGPGVPGSELLVEQAAAVLSASGASEAVVEQAKEKQRQVMQVVTEVEDEAEAKAQLKTILDPDGSLAAQVDPQIDVVLSPWFRFFAEYDPAPTLKKVRAPVLVVAGGKDVQVVAEQNVPEIERALKKGKAKSVRVEVFDELNHLFQHAQTGSVAEYPTIEETVAPEVLELLATWIGDVTKGR